MKRADFLEALSVVATAIPMGAAAAVPSRQIAGIAVPDTAITREAKQLARESEVPAIYNHSLRTFLFAELYAGSKKIDHDVELVYIASILHDTGLSPKYMSAANRFEVDGANVARDLLARHGITGQRADLAWDAIVLHDDGGIARWKQPEVRLVNAGVAIDFGAYLAQLERPDVVSVLKAAPRSGFIDGFLDAVAAVAARKPQATGSSFVVDVGYRRVPGFHLQNFCDAVKDDPFAAYAQSE